MQYTFNDVPLLELQQMKEKKEKIVELLQKELIELKRKQVAGNLTVEEQSQITHLNDEINRHMKDLHEIIRRLDELNKSRELV